MTYYILVLVRINNFETKIWCNDCGQNGVKTVGKMCANISERVKEPGDIDKSNFGDMAYFWRLPLCHTHMIRRRRAGEGEWMEISKAKKMIEHRKEKTGKVPDKVSRGGDSFVAKLERVYRREG